MKNNPEIVMMISISLAVAYKAHMPPSKCVPTVTSRQFIPSNEEGKPISMEKIIRLAKCLPNRLFGTFSMS